jgi:alpha-1,2-mannosyltransferase
MHFIQDYNKKIKPKELNYLKVGIFHPTLNACGGAEWVAVKIINALAKKGHETVVLTNDRVNQNRIKALFGEEAHIGSQFVFPFKPFPPTDLHNIYTDGIRTLLLETKCDILIDTESNALLPGVNITYIHFPILGRLEDYKKENLKSVRARLLYFEPYRLYERRESRNAKRIIFSNSMYTGNAMRRFGMQPTLLYPPIARVFYVNQDENPARENCVVTVARIDKQKRLTTIPEIAKLTNKRIRFLIIGIKQNQQDFNSIIESIERNKVSDRVEVQTDVPQQELQKILRKSKIYLHTSRGEHFGVSLAQAMASGCIPIAYDAGGPKEFVPREFRFTELQDAARKIETAVFGWTLEESKRITKIAEAFSEDNFSSNFLKSFNSIL